MFTGIIEELGEVRRSRLSHRGGRLEVSSRDIWRGLQEGDSVAVNGVCLTVVRVGEGAFEADLSPESISRTNLATLRPGDAVNLERALTLQARLGGHIVQGHVDGVGVVRAVAESGEGRAITIAAPEAIMSYLVEKCSIAVDGISLTVSALGEGWLQVAVIPHTLAVTNLGGRRAGDTVNLEVDIIAKYVRSYLERILSGEEREETPSSSLYRKLEEGGFL